MSRRRMYCGASGDDLGLISPATRFNPVPRYQFLHNVAVVFVGFPLVVAVLYALLFAVER